MEREKYFGLRESIATFLLLFISEIKKKKKSLCQLRLLPNNQHHTVMHSICQRGRWSGYRSISNIFDVAYRVVEVNKASGSWFVGLYDKVESTIKQSMSESFNWGNK